MVAEKELFYKANIHERRTAAIVCRAAPLLSVLAVAALSIYGAFVNQLILLWVTAIFNIALWLWVVATALQCIWATLFMLKDLEHGPIENPTPLAIRDPCGGSGGTGGTNSNSVMHLVVLPNYQEDEDMLAETLRSLAEAEDSRSFWVVLAMEAREGEAGRSKAERLKMRFESTFARVVITDHPDNIIEHHRDGSANPEVPGKASNVKYAVSEAYKECTDFGIHPDNVVLTVADADCLMHPLYFGRLAHEFSHLRQLKEHSWTLWCSPQFSYRNFYTAPIVSRVWAYVQSTYEFGGLSATAWGGHHMVFSSYSLPLSLAHMAEAWDGDVIAEDHHAQLRCFYYWLYNATYEKADGMGDIIWRSKIPPLRLRPLFLPTKSTSVVGETNWKSWTDRWQQAKRHAHGVSELSYALLATWDALQTCLLPKRIFNLSLFLHMLQVVIRVWCMHVLPICQTICLAVLTIKWIRNNRNIDYCPDKLWFFGDLEHWDVAHRYVLCGFAGAWVLTWPVVIPWLLMVVSNVLVIYKVFLRPAMLNRYASIWHAEDGKVPGESRGLSHQVLRVALVIMFDCLFGMSWILVPYGVLVELIAYINVLRYGNCKFSYVTASKGMPAKKLPSSYGAVDKGYTPVKSPKAANDQENSREPIVIA